VVTSKGSRAAPVAQSSSLAGRRFSKAKSVADRLGVCPRTVFRWADAGKIARYKVNARVVLFDEAEVAAFIESARVGCERRNEVVVVGPAKRRQADRPQAT
jgi:excisionase family DNA binding protein